MSDTSGRTRSRVSSFPALAAAVTALTLVAAGCSGDDSSGTSGDGAPTAAYSGVVPAAEPPAPEGFSKAEIEKITINVPDGWATEKTDGALCMRPPGQARCGYGAIKVIPKVAENSPGKWPTKGEKYNSDDGWAPEPTTCRSLTTWEDGGVKAEKDAELHGWDGDGTVKLADGLKANRRVWTVSCENGDTFEVRLWLLPTSDIAVYAWSVDSQYASLYEKVATSMDTSDYKR